MTPKKWNFQTISLVAGISLFIAALVFAWLAVSAVEKTRTTSVSNFQLATPPSNDEINQAADSKNKVITAAYLATFGFVAILFGFPILGGAILGIATNAAF